MNTIVKSDFNQVICSLASLPSGSNTPSWLFELNMMLPQLLQTLLTQTKPPSFERMQLVSIEIEIMHELDHEENICSFNHTELTTKPEQMMTLLSVLHNKDRPIAKLAINYFLRGQRQYFKHAQAPELDFLKNLPAISLKDIESFFKTLHQPYDYFTNKDLARLNGITLSIVPVPMILAVFVGLAFIHLPLAKRFTLQFHHALFVDKPISVSHKLVGNQLHLSLQSEQKIIITGLITA